MSYVAPVTDRSILDMLNLTSKAYFNVSDWTRIYGNAQYVNNFVATLLGIGIPFDTAATPTISTIPQVTDLNALLANINRIATLSCLPDVTIAALYLACTWGSGPTLPAPDYTDANQWEANLDSLLTYETGMTGYWIHCGVAACGQVRFWQSRFRRSS
jgi:hypothetical protein